MANNQNKNVNQEEINAQNNANNIRNVADVAMATKNPYAMAAGGAVKVADKLTGGKASEVAGKAMTKINKIAPGGRMIQSASNKLSESGASNIAGRVASFKNKSVGDNSISPRRNYMGVVNPYNNPTEDEENPENDIDNEENQASENIQEENKKNDDKKSGLFGLGLGKGKQPDNDRYRNFKKIINFIKKHKMLVMIILIAVAILFVTIAVLSISHQLGAMFDLSEDYKAATAGIGTSGNKYSVEEIESALLYVGDSRTVNIKQSLNKSSVKYMAEVGKSYPWFKNSVIPSLSSLIEDNSTKFLVIAMGYNDLSGGGDGNRSNYIEQFNSLVDKYPDVNLFFMSVNPVEEDKEREIAVAQENMSFVSNATINNFNSYISQELGDKFMSIADTIDGYSTSDGVHYDSATAVKVHNAAVKYIQDHTVNPNGGTYNTDLCALKYQDGTWYLTQYPQTDSCNVPRFNDNDLGLEPNFYKLLMDLVHDAERQGCSISFSETYRSRSQQQYFYNCYITKSCNNGNVAAQPGYSKHEYGLAADLGYSSSWCSNYMHNNASKYGLWYPMDYEPWHIQPKNIV